MKENTAGAARLEGLDGYLGGRTQPEKHPVLWCTVTARGHGAVNLLVHAMVTGREEEADQPGWFEIYYHGYVYFEKRYAFGHFLLRVEGSGLKGMCHYLRKGVLPHLKEGPQDNSEFRADVKSITLRHQRPAMLDDEPED